MCVRVTRDRCASVSPARIPTWAEMIMSDGNMTISNVHAGWRGVRRENGGNCVRKSALVSWITANCMPIVRESERKRKFREAASVSALHV